VPVAAVKPLAATPDRTMAKLMPLSAASAWVVTKAPTPSTVTAPTAAGWWEVRGISRWSSGLPGTAGQKS
jgi:hypothetical protein